MKVTLSDVELSKEIHKLYDMSDSELEIAKISSRNSGMSLNVIKQMADKLKMTKGYNKATLIDMIINRKKKTSSQPKTRLAAIARSKVLEPSYILDIFLS